MGARTAGAGLALLAGLTLGPGGVQEIRSEDARYPCVAQPEVLRFFQLDTDEPDLAGTTAALAELEAAIAYGPRTAGSRPGHAFVTVRAPRDASPRALAKALRKAGGKARELECLAFEGRTNAESDIHVAGLTLNSRDFVLGLSGDIAWFDSAGGWTQFYGTPGDLDPGDLVHRYETLYAPYGGGVLGMLVRERFSWTLDPAPDDRAAAKVLKAVKKLDGVLDAALEGSALTVTVVLEALATGGASGPIDEPGADDRDPEGRAPPRLVWDTGPLRALLLEAGVLPAEEGAETR